MSCQLRTSMSTARNVTTAARRRADITDLGACDYGRYVLEHPHPLQQPSQSSNGVTFSHSPIHPQANQIRLLRVGQTSTQDEALSCMISTASLDSSPRYIASSYTWGSVDASTREIQIDGKSYEVRENLFNFLYSFRNDRANDEGVHLWIDQICIDQQNKKEQSASIRLMPRIYQQATYVLQLLGCDSETVEAARDFDANYSISSMTVLLDNRYFTRLWIIQEILLARAIRVFCGNIWLSFEAMERSASQLKRIVDLRWNPGVRRTSVPLPKPVGRCSIASDTTAPMLAQMLEIKYMVCSDLSSKTSRWLWITASLS